MWFFFRFITWEQRKLGDIVDRVVRKNINLESTLPLTISAQYGLVDQVEYFNNRVASRDVSGYYLVKNGEFAYNKSYSDGYPFGAIKRLDMYKMGVLSTLYIVFAIKSNEIDSEYLIAYYETDKWHRQVAERAAEGARNHGLLNISAADFFETKLKHPFEMGEQSKIGQLFRRLDNLITLHQRKQNDKFLLFEPKNYANFLANSWEQRKLGNTIDFYSGLTYSPSDVVKDNGVFVLRSSNVREGEIVEEDNVYVRAGAVNSDNVNIGDIIVVVRNGSRSLIGKHAKIKKNMPQTVIGAFMTGLRYENSSYLNAVLNTSIFEKEIEKDLGATINQITTGAFKKMVFPFPKQHEQLQIGDFFEQIDNLITLHQRGLIKIQGDKNGKKRNFRRIIQRLF